MSALLFTSTLPQTWLAAKKGLQQNRKIMNGFYV
jgi:hypothetical protein